MIAFKISKNTLLMQGIINQSFEQKKEFFVNNYLVHINSSIALERCSYVKALNYAILMASTRLIGYEHQLTYLLLGKNSTDDLGLALNIPVLGVNLSMAYYYMPPEEQKHNHYIEAFVDFRIRSLQQNKVFFNFDSGDYGVAVGRYFLADMSYTNSAMEVAKRLLLSTPDKMLLTLKVIDEKPELNHSYEQILNLLITYMLRYEIEQEKRAA